MEPIEGALVAPADQVAQVRADRLALLGLVPEAWEDRLGMADGLHAWYEMGDGVSLHLIEREEHWTNTTIDKTNNMCFSVADLDAFIDRLGRRTLLMWGVSGMIICLFAIGTLFYLNWSSGPWLLIFIIGFIASFASSLGPIPWVMISEIFHTKTRGIAMSFATVILWIGVVLITQLTPMMLEGMGGAFTFYIFMINAVILLVFTYRLIPETKGKTLEEIEKSWKKNG
jgi:MFS transporter, SP family, arabinose:H+ symporter